MALSFPSMVVWQRRRELPKRRWQEFLKKFGKSGDRQAAASAKLAERVGFEPTVQFPAHTLSKRAP